jgi:hypothetical protein
MYPLSSGFNFRDVAISMTAMSKVETALPVFPVEAIPTESANRFLAKVETNAKKLLGSYVPREHDVCVLAMLPNGGHLNQVFEEMGVPYAPRPLSGTEAFTAVTKKQKGDVLKKTVVKKMKVAKAKVAPVKTPPPKKIGICQSDPAKG